MILIKGKNNSAKIFAPDIDNTTREQIERFVDSSVFENELIVMPDCHAGAGSCIGTTIKIGKRVVPNVVGVDIGCGMLSICLGKEDFPESSILDEQIREAIPFGFNIHRKPVVNMERDFPWMGLSKEIRDIFMKIFEGELVPTYNHESFKKKCLQIGTNYMRVGRSIGTLGGGNHFIEFGEDIHGQKWLTIHSGSRNFGLKVANYWQKVAKRTPAVDIRNKVEELKSQGRHKEISSELKKLTSNKVKDLEYLEDDEMVGYLADMFLAQVYASLNRETMAKIILDLLESHEPTEIVESTHNYIDFRDMIVRKGAISSYEGEFMVIPFSQEDGMIIAEGKSNPEWNYSAPHGAGRVLSRRQANSTLSVKDYSSRMSSKGIFSTSVNSNTLDESKLAYKDPEMIKKEIEPTAKIVNIIKPFHNLKDDGRRLDDTEFVLH